MDIYVIRLKGDDCLIIDYYVGHVIAAKSPKDVRDIAKAKDVNKRDKAWDNAIVERIGKYNGRRVKPYIILSDYIGY